ncbi:hypothetical protein JCM10207_006826 [Rhodosporidiobolus poonsookiae]
MAPHAQPAPPAAPSPSDPLAVDHIRSIFSPDTLVRRGFCTVAQGTERDSAGHRVYYELHGEDKPTSKRLVLIMGLSNSSFAWQHQVRHFASQPGYATLVFDNRGVGWSDTPSPTSHAGRGYRTSEMARDVRELLQFVGWLEEGRRTLHVVGISMGGMIAQELALLIPTHLRTVLLTSTKSGHNRSLLHLPDLPTARATRMVLRQLVGLAKAPEQQVEGIVEVLFPEEWLEERVEEEGGEKTRREVVVKDFLHRYHLGRRQTPAGRLAQTLAVMTHHVPPSSLRRIAESVPRVRVIHGEDDQLIRVGRGKELSEDMPGSHLTLIPHAGHALPVQIREQYNEWIRAAVEEEWTAEEEARARGG